MNPRQILTALTLAGCALALGLGLTVTPSDSAAVVAISPTATASRTPVPTRTPTDTRTPVPTKTPTATPSPTVTRTPTVWTTYGPCVTPTLEYAEDNGTWWIERCGVPHYSIITIHIDETKATPVRLPGTPVPDYQYCAKHDDHLDVADADLQIWPCTYPGPDLTPIEIPGNFYADYAGNSLYSLPTGTPVPPDATPTASPTDTALPSATTSPIETVTP